MKTFKLIALAAGIALSSLVFAAPTVEMQTNAGKIVIELDSAKAQSTVKNFLRYAKEGFYDGTVFHRVINGFMIQGGGFTADMRQKDTHEPIQNEAKNGLRNERGTIAMARTGDPHSATAQFFINHKSNPPSIIRHATAGATPSSARLPRAWISWTKSPRSEPAAAISIRMFPSNRSSSSPSKFSPTNNRKLS